jgi:catechol 2,3-dioxygenase-like lactoylglutathione lyase family enzyme
MDAHRRGAVCWIDHYVVPTNDLPRHLDFMKNVLGAGVPERMMWLTTRHRMRNAPLPAFCEVGHYHHNGGFLQNRLLPEMKPLGQGVPRYGYYVRRADMDEHLRRLDANDCPHTDPIDVSHEGQEGTTIYFADYDGNQYEFWAPRHMPPGAMEADNAKRIGRISHVVLESRDLDRTYDFYSDFCGLDVIQNHDLAEDSMVFQLEAGGRMIFKLVPELSERTGTHNKWTGQHAALTVRDDEFLSSYRHLWEKVPESQHRRFQEEVPDVTNLPPRTELHGLVALRERDATFMRGTSFYDWDTNCYHFVGGQPLDGSMAHYASTFDDTNMPADAYADLPAYSGPDLRVKE